MNAQTWYDYQDPYGSLPPEYLAPGDIDEGGLCVHGEYGCVACTTPVDKQVIAA